MSRRAAGLRAWLMQRVSALFLAGYLVYLVAFFALTPPADHGELITWLSHPLTSVSLMLCIVMLLLHAWVGFRDVLLDYAAIFALRLTLLAILATALLACALWALRILLTPVL